MPDGEQSPNQPQPQQLRAFFSFGQFNIRTLMILMLIIAVPLAYYVRYRKHFIAIKTLKENNAEISWSRKNETWLDRQLGDYRFDSVVEVEIFDAYFSDNISPIADLESLKIFAFYVEGYEGDKLSLEPLRRHKHTLTSYATYCIHEGSEDVFKDFTNLETFWIQDDGIELWCLTGNKNLTTLCTECNDDTEGLKEIVKMKSLTSLSIKYPPNIDPLAELTQLEDLLIHFVRIDDVEPLIGLKRLQSLELSSGEIPEAERVRLQQALPNCDIYFSDD